MNAIENKELRHAYIALLFGDSRLKHWTDEGLKELSKETAEVLLSLSWKKYHNRLKKKRKLSKPKYDSNGIWYDIAGLDTDFDVSLRIDFRPNRRGIMYVDG